MNQDAKLAFETGKFNEALALYLELHYQNPKDLTALEGVARSLYQLKRYDEALEYCTLMLTVNEDVVWPHILRAYIHFLQKRPEASWVEANIAFDKAPNDWETIFLWGSLLTEDDKTIDEGIAYLEEAAKLQKQDWSVYNNLARAYSRKEQWGKYRDALREKNRLKPVRFFSILSYIDYLGYFLTLMLFFLHYGLVITAFQHKNGFYLTIPVILDLSLIIAGSRSLINHFQTRYKEGFIQLVLGLVNILFVLLVWQRI